MSERRLQKYLLDNVDGTGHWKFVESKEVSPGFPDINFCVNGVEGWVELKHGTDKKPPTLRPTQCAWFRRRVGVKGNCWLLLAVAVGRDNYFYLLHGKDVPALVKANGIEDWTKNNIAWWHNKIDWKEFISICTNLL